MFFFDHSYHHKGHTFASQVVQATSSYLWVCQFGHPTSSYESQICVKMLSFTSLFAIIFLFDCFQNFHTASFWSLLEIFLCQWISACTSESHRQLESALRPQPELHPVLGTRHYILQTHILCLKSITKYEDSFLPNRHLITNNGNFKGDK